MQEKSPIFTMYGGFSPSSFLCNLIHELIEVAYISHDWVFDFRNFVSADASRDECTKMMHLWCFSEKCLEVSFFIEHSLKSDFIIACEPGYDLIYLSFRTSFSFHFRDIERIDFHEGHVVYLGGGLHSDTSYDLSTEALVDIMSTDIVEHDFLLTFEDATNDTILRIDR